MDYRSMTGAQIAALGRKVAMKSPLTEDERAAVEQIMAPNPILQGLVFKTVNEPDTRLTHADARPDPKDDASD